MATTLVVAGWCHVFAQGQSEQSSAGSGSKVQDSQADAKPPVFKFRIDAVPPTTPVGDFPGANTSGQIPNVGGPLQFYANLRNVTLWQSPAASMNKTPFGGEFRLQLLRDRAELFGGIAGVYSIMGTQYTRPYTWLTQAKLGGSVALDPAGHFWVGTTTYYLTNFAEKTRQWVTRSADFTIRFGK
jgi:hypothetical protein